MDEELLHALRCAKRFIDLLTDVEDPDISDDAYDARVRYLAAIEELPTATQDYLDS